MDIVAEERKMVGKLAKMVRNITVPPVMAGVMILLLWLKDTDILGGLPGLICSICFLVVLPVLAYPLQKFIPGYRDKGREGQRSLAMVFAVSGYVLGCLQSLFSHAGTSLWAIYLEYLLSGISILVFNKCLHLRASGHACGVGGPLSLLVYFNVPALLPGICVLAVTWWASLKTRRHTVLQLLGGTAIPICVACILYLLFH